MNASKSNWPSVLEEIARIRDPRERAKALLRLKRPPVTDVHYLQLVYSVELCGDPVGVSVALRSLKLLQKRDRSEFGDALLLLVDPSKMGGTANLLFDRSEVVRCCEQIKDPEMLADYLLSQAFWTEEPFAEALLYASGGNGIAARLLRAKAIQFGFMQELNGSVISSVCPTLTSGRSPAGPAKKVSFEPKAANIKPVKLRLVTTSEAN
jgi:hypothetical protein